MKTIQEIIREMYPEQIVKAYCREYPIEIDGLDEIPDDITVGELKERRIKELKEFIQSLLEVEPKPYDGRQSILFLSKGIDGIEKNLICVYADEVLKADSFDRETVPSYAFYYSDREDVMSFLVADNKLTQDDLMNLVIKFLREVSFFGYDEKGLKKAQNKLNKALKEIDEGHFISKEEMDEEFGAFEIERYPEEEELQSRHIEAERAYIDYCRGIELKLIKERLKAITE